MNKFITVILLFITVLIIFFRVGYTYRQNILKTKS